MRAALPVIACLLAAAPAAADWLVPVNGPAIETVGGWERTDRAVVFRDKGGRLLLLPSSEIDWRRTEWQNLHPAVRAVGSFVEAHRLEISDPVTLRWVVGAMVGQERGRRAKPAAPTRSAPRWVITDADVAHVTPKVELPPEQFPMEWRRSFDSERLGELLIVGTLSNDSEETVRSVSVEVRFLDDRGEIQESQTVDIEPRAVAPGERVEFRCTPRRGGFSEIDFGAVGRLGEAG